PYLIGTAFLIPVLVVAFSWRFYILNMQQDSQSWSAAINTNQTEVNSITPSTSAINIPKKEFITAKSNLPEAYHQECHQNNPSTDLVKCEFGDTQSTKTILLVGNSHSTQWLPALDQISKNKNFKLINITKSECPLGLLKDSSDACKVWHKKLIDFIETSKPYAIITTSTRAGKDHAEYVPQTYIQQWKVVSQFGVKIVAIRDNPWFNFDPPLCVARNKNETLKCSKSKDDALQKNDPSEGYTNNISNLLLVDMTRFLCNTELCFAATSDQLIYRDSHHLSVPYVQSLTNKLSEELDTFL
ncbi:MAG: SGNH hydrolase domain-containing protein, partial [Psychromonas sp.]